MGGSTSQSASPERVATAWASLQRRERWRITEGAHTPAYSTREASRRSNADANRYTDVSPYDSTLVRLPGPHGYVNASSIVDVAGRKWIASQGPLPNTCEAFWRIVTDLPEAEAPRVIVMLTGVRYTAASTLISQLVEGGRTKCERYFPRPGDKPMRFGGITVALIERTDRPHWQHSRLAITRDGDERAIEVQHLDHTSWPDHGVPSSPRALLELVAELRRLTADRPCLVHCSAGVGRTGTTIASSALTELLPALELPDARADPPGMPAPSADDAADSVFRAVDQLREQRMMLVQTREQLAFVYAAVDAARRS